MSLSVKFWPFEKMFDLGGERLKDKMCVQLTCEAKIKFGEDIHTGSKVISIVLLILYRRRTKMWQSEQKKKKIKKKKRQKKKKLKKK